MKKKTILMAALALLAVAGAVFAFTLQKQETAASPAVPAKPDACCMSKEETGKTATAESVTAKDACCAKK